MKRLVFVGIVLIPVIMIGAQDYVSWSDRMTPLTQEPTHEVGRFDFSRLSPEDTFMTFAYTYGDIVIFSFKDDNHCKIIDSEGGVVAEDTLMLDEYLFAQDIPWGVYLVTASEPVSVLSGDPWGQGLGCWYAVDEESKPLGTKLLSVGPKTAPSGNDACMVVFAYHDNTHVIVRNLDNEQIIFEGDLDSAEYWIQDHGDVPPVFYSVEATYPVSTMTACGVNGMYIPSFNGTFTGTDFMAYQHSWGGTPQDCQIISWNDNTTVTMHALDDPGLVFREEFCAEKGDVKMFNIPVREAVYIRSDKPISLSQTEWWSFGLDKTYICAFYMARGIDPDGLGLGKEFYLPIEVTYEDSPSRLHVIAFKDNTHVTVTRTPKNSSDELFVWKGFLNQGECYRSTNGEVPAVFHVVSDKDMVAIGSCKDRQGSDFLPVVHISPAGFFEEPTENSSGNWQILNPIGQGIVLRYVDCLQGFHAQVFDVMGRKVDEIHIPDASGTVIWGEGYRTGVYFISPFMNDALPRKAVLVR